MNNNIYTLFESRFPDDLSSPCLRAGELQLSYKQLISAVDDYARYLQHSPAAPGDRVLVQISKSPQNLIVYLACLKSGLIYLPLNTAYLQHELNYFFNDAEPAICICDPLSEDIFAKMLSGSSSLLLTLDNRNHGTLVEAVEQRLFDAQEVPQVQGVPTVARNSEDTAVIIYTSGTTGLPKGAMISHGNLSANGLTLLNAWGWAEGDVMLHTLPLFHVHGLFLGCHLPLLSGNMMIFEEKFDVNRVVDELPNATVYMGVPTHYTRLLGSGRLSPAVCANMRLFTSGSAPLLAQTFHEFRASTGHTILERYGMTETGMNTSNPLMGARKPGTVGPALRDVQVRVVDSQDNNVSIGETGSLLVKGPNVFSGYWRKPDKTREDFTGDGYFRTGDLACIDEDAYVTIVGRSKDLIISGGLNVYPKELESIIDDMDGVLESAVIGIPDKDFGEAVTAIIVADGSCASLCEASIISALKARVANFKVAKSVHFVNELPRNAMGKVQKNALRDQFGGK